MCPEISVIVPAHNPRPDPLSRVLAALNGQTLAKERWDLVVVDNASAEPLRDRFPVNWHPQGRHVREERTGLTPARLAGIAATTGSIVIFVDDDNVLDPDYLEMAARIGRERPEVAAWSGNVELVFEPGVVPPPAPWRHYLTERHCTSPSVSKDPNHHDSTPWGAGLCIRRVLADAYRERCAREPDRLVLDLNGKELAYGGDTDIAYVGCDLGYAKGVFPQLRVRHLIPAERCKREYIERSIEGHAYSEQVHTRMRTGGMFDPHRSLRRQLGDLLRYLRMDTAERIEWRAKRRGLWRAWNSQPGGGK